MAHPHSGSKLLQLNVPKPVKPKLPVLGYVTPAVDDGREAKAQKLLTDFTGFTPADAMTATIDARVRALRFRAISAATTSPAAQTGT